MRRETAQKRERGRLRLPTDIHTVFVPCSQHKHGRHPLTVAFENAQLLHVSVGCSDKKLADTDKRLGGASCIDAGQSIKDMIFEGARKEFAIAGVSFYEARDQVKKIRAERKAAREAEEAKNKSEDAQNPEARWNKLFTQIALDAAKFPGISVRIARAAADHDVTNNEVPAQLPTPKASSLTLELRFGKRFIARRVEGIWRIDEPMLVKELESNGGDDVTQPSGSTGKYCEVCAREYAYFAPHLRKGRHTQHLIEGFKRVMFRLRRKRVDAKISYWAAREKSW